MDEVSTLSLDKIDVSRPELFHNDTWQPWFARLRKEAPVHFQADSVNGPFWSVTSHELIKEVDSNNAVFSSSSEFGGIAIVDPPRVEGQVQGQSFITMDGLYLLGFGPRTAAAARDLSVKLYPALAEGGTFTSALSAANCRQ